MAAVVQPQTNVVYATPTVMQVAPMQVAGDAYKRSLKGLGIAEVVMGSIVIILGIIPLATFGAAGGIRTLAIFSVGEGVWGGILVVVAGSLAIATSNPGSKPVVASVCMGFSIVACLATLVVMGLTGRLFPAFSFFFLIPALAVFPIMFILSIPLFIMLIINAVYCGKVNGCCGPPPTTQTTGVVYTNTTATYQQPAVMQGGGYTQPAPQYGAGMPGSNPAAQQKQQEAYGQPNAQSPPTYEP